VTSPTQTSTAAEVATHPHGRVPRELRRRQLLELATDLFAELGFGAASMDELATRAGVSKPVIYDLFGSKEGLLVAAIDALGIQLSEVVTAAVAGRTEPEDLLRTGSLAFFGFVGEHRAAWAMVFAASRSLSGHSPEASRKLDEIRSRQDGLVSAVILASARELGADADPLEVSAITRGLNGVYEGLVEWWGAHPDVEAERLADWTVALVLPGLAAMAAPPSA
jgi:AcrR family transcriptional regulator